jgi:sialate O-acetylesterase
MDRNTDAGPRAGWAQFPIGPEWRMRGARTGAVAAIPRLTSGRSLGFKHGVNPVSNRGHAALSAGAALLLASLAPLALADVSLHPLFTDHGVLQQGKRLPVWGHADDGEKVTVEFAGQKVSTVAVDGRWRVTLKPLAATAEGRSLKVTGKNSVEISDVVVGEVWICSGQSNMEWSMSSSFEPASDIASSANPNIRLFTVTKRRSPHPETELGHAKHAWAVAAPDVVKSFSAVGYYFGRDLQPALGVPVGLIHTSWGGSPAEVWMSEEVLKGNHEYSRDIVDAYAPALRGYVEARNKWMAAKKAAEAKGEKFNQGGPWTPWYPTELYNGMLRPLMPYAIAGAIWYQGESNAGRAWQYRSLFADMIRNWRKDWGQGDFPFLAVQLAPWDKNRKRSLAEITAKPVDSDWAELREAQNHVAETLQKVGVAVITDVGDKDDIHPTKKAPVGQRLSLLAQTIAYGKPVESSGPTYASTGRSGSTLVLNFNHAKGLKTSDGAAPTGFAIAGDDGVYHWATAEIVGQSVRLSCPAVPKPKTVRYGWSDNPVVNLVNADGLPASPFRTDDLPATTKK